MAAPTSTNQNRYVRGPYDAGSFPAASGIQTNIGDLVYFRSGDVAPISQYPCLSGNELQTWSGARSQFLGVALSQHKSTATISGSVTVAFNGIFSFPGKVDSGVTYQPGTWVAPTQDQHSGYFGAQQLMQASGQATGIGKVVEQITPPSSGVGNFAVYLQSTVVKGTIGGT